MFVREIEGLELSRDVGRRIRLPDAKILVTGATGKTGGALVEPLRLHDWPVGAPVRRNDARSARLQGLGAEVGVADMFDPVSLHEAPEGVQRAYFYPVLPSRTGELA